jgi:hypothetical protein
MNTTEKISITLGRAELQQAKILASRMGLSLSTVITDAVREHVEAKARKAAGVAVLATFAAADRASERKMQQLLREWGEPEKAHDEAPRAGRVAARSGSQPKRRAR